MENVKDSKINMFIEEFELFHIEPREFVDSMQTRFLHLINKLRDLDKTFPNKVCTKKILRSMCKEWKTKVTAIKEANDLNTLDITKLFGKLVEHENELKRLADSEVKSKKKEKVKEEK